MPDTFTSKYNFTLPEVGGSVDTWGTKLNANFGLLDDILRDLYLDHVGDLVISTSATIPRRCLKCNGQEVSRTTYSDLWDFADASGNIAATEGAKTVGQFGPGDGSTTFTLPDYRGYFLRAHDDGAGVDSARTLESIQNDQNKAHTHTGTTSSNGSHNHGGTGNAGAHNHDGGGLTGWDGGHSHSGSTSTDGGHSHSDTGNDAFDGGQPNRFFINRTAALHTASTNGAGNHNHSLNINGVGDHRHTYNIPHQSSHSHSISSDGAHTHTFTTASSGGTEVRVKNLAVRIYIRY